VTPLLQAAGLVVLVGGVAVAAGAPSLEVALGAAGPLLAAVVTWWLVVRAWRTAPGDLTAVLLKAFAGKMVFFGAYVLVVGRGFPLSLTVFAVSFTVSFVGIYAVEALMLQRLQAGAR
jgi:hypothetical protein